MISSRRQFITSLVGGIAAGAAIRTWPFRVFSFPTEIVTRPARPVPIYSASGGLALNIDEIRKFEALHGMPFRGLNTSTGSWTGQIPTIEGAL